MATIKDEPLATIEQCREIIKHATDEKLAAVLLSTIGAYIDVLAPVDQALIFEAALRLSR